MKRYFSLILLASNAMFAHQISLEQSINYAKNIVSIIQAGQEEQYEMGKLIVPDLIDALTKVASTDAQPCMHADVARLVIDAVLDHHGLANPTVIEHVFQEVPTTEITNAITGATSDIFSVIKEGNIHQIKQAIRNNPEVIFKKDPSGNSPYDLALQSQNNSTQVIIDELLHAALQLANNECPVCLSSEEDIKQESDNGLDVANTNCMHFMCKLCKKDLAHAHKECPLCRKHLE